MRISTAPFWVHASIVSVHGSSMSLIWASVCSSPNFDFDADRDPAFHSSADPDPASPNYADPDPQPRIQLPGNPFSLSTGQCGILHTATRDKKRNFWVSSTFYMVAHVVGMSPLILNVVSVLLPHFLLQKRRGGRPQSEKDDRVRNRNIIFSLFFLTYM